MVEVGVPPTEIQKPLSRRGRFDGDRFAKTMRGMSDVMFRSVDVVHEHRVAELPMEKRAVFATSHLTDFDEQAVAAALSPYRTLDMSSAATNLKDPVQKTLIALAGRDRLHGLANIFDKKNNEPVMGFNPANFDPMREAMEKGHDMIFSAHNPARDGRLPDKPGIGAVYLAHLAGTPVMPVAVDIHADKSYGMASEIGSTVKQMVRGRPDASVIVGEAMQLEPIPAADLADIALFGSKEMKDMRTSDPARYARIKATHAKLKAQSEDVMRAIAAMLPPEKQGKWGPNSQIPQGSEV